MVLPVEHRQLGKIEGTDPIEASHVHRDLGGIETALVEGMNATARAEMVLRGVRVELIGGNGILSGEEPQRRARRRRASHGTADTTAKPPPTPPTRHDDSTRPKDQHQHGPRGRAAPPMLHTTGASAQGLKSPAQPAGEVR